MKTLTTCSVANQDCESPAGWGSSFGYGANNYGPSIKTTCFICGEPVCKTCSSLVTYRGHRVRACATCLSHDYNRREIKNLAAPPLGMET